MMSTEMPPLFTISRTDNSMVSKVTNMDNSMASKATNMVNKVFREKALVVDVVLDGAGGTSLVEVVVLAVS